jgi:hypothetical protein
MVACLYPACSPRPAHVLSDKEMEDVLYDLYLTEAVIDEHNYIFNNDSSAKEKLLNSVFQKHQINAQTFDTSLVWYNQNMEKYLKVNGRVKERFSSLSDNFKTRIDQAEREKRAAELQNLFPVTTSFFLQSPGFFQNRHVFKTDSLHLETIRAFYLAFQVLGVRDSVYPTLTFCLQTGDTVFVNRDTIRAGGAYSRTFSVPAQYTVKEIYGVFSIPDEEKNRILFNDIVLFDESKMPDKPEEKPALPRRQITN